MLARRVLQRKGGFYRRAKEVEALLIFPFVYFFL